MSDAIKPGEIYKQSQYMKLGGEAGIRQLVRYFYQAMDTLSSAKPIRKMHAADLSEAEEKLYLFLSGWLGCPSLYMEKHGHPRLRARHLPFKISDKERDQWLQCMESALTKMDIEKPMHDELMQAFFNTADFMRNQQN
jgi:hemoglobin